MPDRPPRDPRVDVAIAELAPPVRAVATSLRALVRKHAPELSERLMWQNPVWVGRERAICLMLFDSHVNLGFFRGRELARRFPEIEGTGKNLRHVKVPAVASARRAVLPRIVRAAVALDAHG